MMSAVCVIPRSWCFLYGLLISPRKRADAFDRAVRSEIAAFALIVDAKDEAATAFYRHHGFIALPDSLSMFLPLATAKLS